MKMINPAVNIIDAHNDSKKIDSSNSSPTTNPFPNKTQNLNKLNANATQAKIERNPKTTTSVEVQSEGNHPPTCHNNNNVT